MTLNLKLGYLRTSLCDYSDEYIIVSGIITITGAGADDATKWLVERNKGVMFKSCAPFTDRLSEIIILK